MEMTATNKKPLLTINETAREYGVPNYGIRGLVKTGKFPVIQCGNRVYISREVFENYLAKGGERLNENR